MNPAKTIAATFDQSFASGAPAPGTHPVCAVCGALTAVQYLVTHRCPTRCPDETSPTSEARGDTVAHSPVADGQ